MSVSNPSLRANQARSRKGQVEKVYPLFAGICLIPEAILTCFDWKESSKFLNVFELWTNQKFTETKSTQDFIENLHKNIFKNCGMLRFMLQVCFGFFSS